MKEPPGKPKRWKQDVSSSTPSPPFHWTVRSICMSFFTTFVVSNIAKKAK